jgi:hypothetical protein
VGSSPITDRKRTLSFACRRHRFCRTSKGLGLCGNREVGFVLPGRSAKREIRAGFVTTDMLAWLATFSLGCGSDACFWPQHGMSVMSRSSGRVEELIDLDALAGAVALSAVPFPAV